MKKKLLFLFLIGSLIFDVVYAQQTISGQVTDAEDGEPLPGVNILVKGTSSGTVSDFNGNYSLSVEEGTILVFSFVGYQPQELSVGSQTVLNVSLNSDVTQLSEIVVVGFGTQIKRDLTGAVGQIKAEQIEGRVLPSFEAALQGQTPGVQVIQGSGLAGSPVQIKIRGNASVSGGVEPLYVVDGIPITTGDFSNTRVRNIASNTNALANINPNDIESIEILKDAAAGAIYGSRASNGVVLITTKSGAKGKGKFNVSYNASIQEETIRQDLLNSAEFVELYQEAHENSGGVGDAVLPGGLSREEALSNDTDWQDEVLQKGFSQDLNVSFSKATEKYNLFASGSFSDQETFITGNEFRRINGRINFDYNILENLKVGFKATYGDVRNDRVPVGFAGGLGAAQGSALPIFPIREADGTFFVNGANPVRELELNLFTQKERRAITTAFIEYEILPGLKVRSENSIDYLDQNEDFFDGQAFDVNGLTSGGSGDVYVTNFNTNNYITYDTKINDDHNFTFLLGHQYQDLQLFRANFRASGLTDRIDERTREEIINAVGDEDMVDERVTFQERSRILSGFFRVNYKYKDKYLLTAIARADASSRFGENNQVGYFPSVSSGWIISEEDFFDFGALSFLKLRASWGLTGNDQIPPNGRFGLFTRDPGGFNDNVNQVDVFFPSQLPNPDLKWETTEKIDLGLDFGILQDRISGTLGYYINNARDIILDVPLAGSQGNGGAQAARNIGEFQTTGWEFNLTSSNLVGNFEWTTNLNLSTVNNEVKDLGGFGPDTFDSGDGGEVRLAVGQPFAAFFLVPFVGVNSENGNALYLDLEGNVTEEFDIANRRLVGSPFPDFFGGITNTFSYKNFELSVFFNFSVGNKIYNGEGPLQQGGINNTNQRREILDRWRQPGDVTDVPKLVTEGFAFENSTRFLSDGSYLRLKTLTLSYNLPPNLLDNIGLSSARVFIGGQNLLTFTEYEQGDPEVVRDNQTQLDRNLRSSVTFFTPPQARVYNIGFNVSF
ncbi:MAG: TonB-dependent receptor [Bacteroidota bacterium]